MTAKEKANELSKQWYRKNKSKVLAQRKAQYKKNPDVFREARRKQELKQYGITMDDYKTLLKLQKGKCAICRKVESLVRRSGKRYDLAVDHCHKTGKVRGLLCRKCNQAIGFLGDDVKGVKKAFDYLLNSEVGNVGII